MSKIDSVAEQTLNFAREVREGLSRSGQKELPSKYLYDKVGTALFEAITMLDEYGLTRADERILHQYSEAIFDKLPSPLLVTELGSGNGHKAKILLEPLAKRQAVHYFPIEISETALLRCRLELASLNNISMVGLEQPYLEGLQEVKTRRRAGETILVLFLGSTVGNFDRSVAKSFLRNVRASLHPGDALLIGIDLVKPVADMLLAYDDPAGVTAAFNLNLLARINKELGGDFALKRFKHEVRYHATTRRIEMHLRSLSKQKISISAAGFSFHMDEGETIWTEASHKFTTEELPGMAAQAGFRSTGMWIDREWPFAENLWIAV